MLFEVDGEQLETGKKAILLINASNKDAAIDAASEMGFVVASVTARDEKMPSPPPPKVEFKELKVEQHPVILFFAFLGWIGCFIGMFSGGIGSAISTVGFMMWFVVYMLVEIHVTLQDARNDSNERLYDPGRKFFK